MIVTLIFYFFVSLTCLWAGFLSEALFAALRNPGAKNLPTKHWIVYAFWGLILMTFFGQLFELFMPVNQYTWFALVLVVVLISIANKDLYTRFISYLKDILRLSPALFLMCSILVIFIGVLNSGPTLMDDTESYHIQMIKWIQEYGTVLGLANLHARYGFNSSWFTFASLFIPLRTDYNFFAIANGVLSAWLGLYLFTGFWNWSQPNKTRSELCASVSCFVIFIVTLLCWPMLRGNATNANYDFVTACMIVVLFVELWKQKNEPDLWKSWLPELFIWPIFMFTVRIINFPVLLMSLFAFVLLWRQKKLRLLFTCSAISLALVLPFLARNVLLSGYIFYPVYQVDIFAVDWKVDAGTAKDLMSYIKYFNRVNSGITPISETQKLGFPEWVSAWFQNLYAYDKPFLLMSIAGYVLIFIRLGKFKKLSLPLKTLVYSMVIQLFSWFVVAPDPRFVYGPILTGIFLLPFLLPDIPAKLFQGYTKLVPQLCFVLFAGLSIYTVFKMAKDHRYLNPLLPYRLPQPPTRLIKIDNIEFRVPSRILGNWNARCYATDLPCLYDFQPGLSARGKTIREGFKLKK